MSGGAVEGVRGEKLEASDLRGRPSARAVVGEFALTAQAVMVAPGGIGGNHELVRQTGRRAMGTPPAHMLSGVPDYVDGRDDRDQRGAGGRVDQTGTALALRRG